MPVNWSISIYPIRDGDLEVSLDTTDEINGEQSLKFVVHRFAQGSRWKPFLFQVRDVEKR